MWNFSNTRVFFLKIPPLSFCRLSRTTTNNNNNKKKIMREESRRGERSNVEMIRIVPRKGEDEELFDVEKELGRDVTSVFGKSFEGEGEGKKR